MMRHVLPLIRRQLRGWRLMIAAALAAVCFLCTALALLPAVSPATGAETADFLRAIFGPAPVAALESASFWAHDLIARNLSSAGAGGPQVAWASGSGSVPLNVPGGVNIVRGKARAQAEPTAQPIIAGQSNSAAAPAAKILPSEVVTAGPQIGWQAYGPAVNGAPAMARALIMVDPARSYAGVALVRMDLTRLSLHLTPGTIEPAHPSGIDKRIPDIGMVPRQDAGILVAAFNGGFKAVHGHYGMEVNGITLLPPQVGIATLAIYKDGRVRIGAWGSDLTQTPDLVSFRQNCPPLIDNGVINSLLSTGARGAWGFTNNQDITWRTAVGITKDGRYLIYAVGNGTNAEFLAEALQKAGAENAMQLDINQYYAHFVTFEAAASASGQGTSLQAERLLQEMIDERSIYLIPQVRDFFFLTAK